MAKKAVAEKLPDGQTPATITAAIQQKFTVTSKEISASLIERGDATDLVLTGLLAGENAVIVGPPGAAKTMLMEAVGRWMKGRVFYSLLTKFTQPEEIFGPLDVVALANSRFRRLTALKLPECDLWIPDEVFKGSTAILNTTLRALNERKFENDGQVIDIPLLMALGCSNEWPDGNDSGKELSALMDRFLLRMNIKAIGSPTGRKRLLWTTDHTPQLSTTITRDEILQARKEVASIPWQSKSMDTMEKILHSLREGGISPGDRRQYKSINAVRAYAYLNGATEVAPEHLEILQHILWNDPVDHPKKCAEIVTKLANPQGAMIMGMMLETDTIMESVKPGDLQTSMAASRKLQEIRTKLDNMKDSDRQKAALDAVDGHLKTISLKAIGAL